MPDTNEVFRATELVKVSPERAETASTAARVIVTVYGVEVPFCA